MGTNKNNIDLKLNMKITLFFSMNAYREKRKFYLMDNKIAAKIKLYLAVMAKMY